MSEYPQPPADVTELLREGLVIPAHPLALAPDGRFDERRQRALSRYYHASGAGGLAVGVHTTQFAIRRPEIGLYQPVLELAVETVRNLDILAARRTVLVAGVAGGTSQAVSEARLASDLGYDAGLLSLAALPDASNRELIDHCRAVASIIPLFGFYLQPAVGGRPLDRAFWTAFCDIPNVVAIKVAPFDRYQTLDVIHGLARSRRASEISLYTGNDDHVLLDLLTTFRPSGPDGPSFHFAGGLLGHWAVWTGRAVEQLRHCRLARLSGQVDTTLLTLAEEVTDANAALFDAANDFAGCIAGIHEVLRRQGLLESTRCLNPDECLSPGQSAEIDRVVRAYPHLVDDAFVREHLDDWLS
jgi:dihydrodipicolinate synthase/N-acetylneuraminate lyase